MPSVSWSETAPDGDIITVSLLDDHIRSTKVSIRERLEEDGATPLTGIFEAASWSTGPIPKMGSGRIHACLDSEVDGLDLQEGRLAYATDTRKLYHLEDPPVSLGYLDAVDDATSGRIFEGFAGTAAWITFTDDDDNVLGLFDDDGDFILSGGLTVNGLTTIDGNVSVELADTTGQFLVSNGSTVSLAVTEDPGQIDLIAPTVFIQGAIIHNGHTTPDTTGNFDLGSTSKRFRDGWFSRNLLVAGEADFSGKLQIPIGDPSLNRGLWLHANEEVRFRDSTGTIKQLTSTVV